MELTVNSVHISLFLVLILITLYIGFNYTRALFHSTCNPCGIFCFVLIR